MKYLCFIRTPEKNRDLPMPKAFLEAMDAFVDTSMKSGVVVQTGGLAPSKDGVRIRLAKGEISVTDGPFSESKEVIGAGPSCNATRRPRRSARRPNSWSFTGSTGPNSKANPRCG